MSTASTRTGSKSARFLVEQCRYVITSRASHEAGLPHGGCLCGLARDSGRSGDRLRRANIFEPHRYAHRRPIRVEQVDATVARAHSNFIAIRVMLMARLAFRRRPLSRPAST